MYESSRSAALVKEKRSKSFSVQHGGVGGCSLAPILFSVFTNALLEELERSELDVELSTDGRIHGMMFANDFVGVSDLEDELQKLIDFVLPIWCKWC